MNNDHFGMYCLLTEGRADDQQAQAKAVATRYDKRAYVFHGTVTVAAIWLWLRP